MSADFPKDNITVRCNVCKAIVYIAVNDPRVIDADAKREICDMMIEGFSVEHMTREQFQKEQFGHRDDCKPWGQLTLTAK